MASPFVDKVTITVRAGDGGNGAVTFHREKYVAAGGPDGGDGGKGGDVVFVVDDNLATLADFRYKRKYAAQNGEPGRGGRQYGRKGQDLEIRVPRGTVIREVQSGAVKISDTNIEQINTENLRQMQSLVTQETHLFHMTIAENLRIAKQNATQQELEQACKKASVHDFIMSLPHGYETQVGELGDTLSGGEKQRLEIARVLAQDPTIIIMDEATSALDSATEYEVVSSVAARGITCIIIAHRLSTIRDCDEIIVMENGVIAERGTHDELYRSNGIYTKLITNE